MLPSASNCTCVTRSVLYGGVGQRKEERYLRMRKKPRLAIKMKKKSSSARTLYGGKKAEMGHDNEQGMVHVPLGFPTGYPHSFKVTRRMPMQTTYSSSLSENWTLRLARGCVAEPRMAPALKYTRWTALLQGGGARKKASAAAAKTSRAPRISFMLVL